ncbi:STAS domain-containing protein [Candidatus Nitrospira bockiana]
MLRISRSADDGATVSLRLEGKIHREWVALLEQECLQLSAAGKRVVLDLLQVSYIDREGVDLVRKMRQGSVRLVNCPAFLQALLRGGQS